MVTTIPSLSGPGITASWTNKPTEWPMPKLLWSSRPSFAMVARAMASSDFGFLRPESVAPGLHAATAACWAA